MRRILRHTAVPTLFALCALGSLSALGATRRIVTTSPAMTEVLFQLGLGGDLVGAVEWSDYPAEAREVPRIGPLAFPGLERIVRVRPTAVIHDVTQPGPDWKEPLERAKIPVVRWTPTSVAAFFQSTSTVLNTIDAPAAAKATLAAWEKRWTQEAATCGASDRVLLLASTDPTIAFGTATFLVDAFARLGFRPVLPGRLSGFASVGPDWMRQRSIDRALWIDFRGPSPVEDLRRLLGDGPKLEALDADVFSRPGWTTLSSLLARFCREAPGA